MVRCLLINPFPESALNEEAGKLFMEDYAQYHKKAEMMTEVHAAASTAKAGEASTAEGEASSADGEGAEKKRPVDSKAAEKRRQEKKKSLKRRAPPPPLLGGCDTLAHPNTRPRRAGCR